MAATFLERENERLTVRTATSPEEGLKILADHDVDCIVSDYDMPHIDGIEFLEIVGRLPRPSKGRCVKLRVGGLPDLNQIDSGRYSGCPTTTTALRTVDVR